MRETTTTTVLTCDRCAKRAESLKTVSQDREAYSTYYCIHETLAELCKSCFAELEGFLMRIR